MQNSTQVFLKMHTLLYSPHTLNRGRGIKVDENKRAEGDTCFLECLTTVFVKFVVLHFFSMR